ncbi:MAG: baseplate J/gp47 family protein, partial [Campylobacterales bacterium]|nr:baseplate J/gp47 family protein [Campylobacterales bacterium]
MFEEIKLDDRSYQEIRDDAINSIVKHCPEWTNHNASDPGVTIIELLSSMTEDMIQRLNQVPNKNYFAFLDLIGIEQRLPQPSSTYVTFFLTEGYQAGSAKKDTILLPKGSVVATEPQNDEDAISYETTRDLYISNVKLLNSYSKAFNSYRDRDDIIDNTQLLDRGEAFAPFNPKESNDNMMQIYLGSDDFDVLKDNANITLIFRLPTTMRLHKISSKFLESMKWEFFDGSTWQNLEVLNEFFFTLDDKDADIISVTFRGDNALLQAWVLDYLSHEDEIFYIRATLIETPSWLKEFALYEISVATQSFPMGVVPQNAFHNYEELNLNNDFYPFGSRPKVDDKLQEEIFYINSTEAFAISGTSISLHIKHSLNPEYTIPKGSDNLKLAWEYPSQNSKWSYLKVTDTTQNFTIDGVVSFEVPKDIESITINGESGSWIRCRILNGNYGNDESNEYDEKSGNVKTTPSTLRPPLLSELRISYSKPRKDITKCYILNNYQYRPVEFIANRPVTLFDFESEREEALYLAFDSYVSEDYFSLYFDIENDTSERNIYKEQQLLEWQLLKDGKWVSLEDVVDETDGLTASGEVTFKMPFIDKLEYYTLYIEEHERMWIKAKIKFSSLPHSVNINRILLNSVEVVQEQTFYDEHIGVSDGLPNITLSLNDKNLSKAPRIFVGDEEFKAVKRLIDYGKNDKVFRYNGLEGVIEFGDGEYGAVPKLGEDIIAKEYSITKGKEGNVNANKITVLMQPLNYIESITNLTPAMHGEDGDSLEDLKKYAPAVIKTMERAISIEDYELLAQSFSPAIKRAKCIAKNGDVIIIPLTQTIIQDRGFINKKLTDELHNYLKERSILSVDPIIVPPTVVTLDVYLKLLYTIEDYNVTKLQLQEELMKNAHKYFDPFSG